MIDSQLRRVLRYPKAWVELGLLSGELIESQRKQLRRRYGTRSRPIPGAEHWRFGAFLWLLERASDERALERILLAALADRDRPMAGDVVHRVVSHRACSERLLSQALAGIAASPEYYASAEKLHAAFRSRVEL